MATAHPVPCTLYHMYPAPCTICIPCTLYIVYPAPCTQERFAEATHEQTTALQESLMQKQQSARADWQAEALREAQALFEVSLQSSVVRHKC